MPPPRSHICLNSARAGTRKASHTQRTKNSQHKVTFEQSLTLQANSITLEGILKGYVVLNICFPVELFSFLHD